MKNEIHNLLQEMGVITITKLKSMFTFNPVVGLVNATTGRRVKPGVDIEIEGEKYDFNTVCACLSSGSHLLKRGMSSSRMAEIVELGKLGYESKTAMFS